MSKGKIYIKNPWATRILQGIKFIETRTFRLPDRFIDIYLDIQNENGFIVGSVKFCKSFKYESEEHFNRDQFAHLVEKDSPFHYTNRSKVHGWLIQDVKPCEPKMAYKFKSQFPLELYPSPIS